MCRLDGRRRAGALSRRLWIGASVGGFAVLGVVAVANNARQGLALIVLAIVVVGMAIVYDRSLRRNGLAMPALRRRARAAPESVTDHESP